MPTIKLRRGTSAEWTTANPILADGEPGFERDTDKHKIGDGSTHWVDLPYYINETLVDSKITTAMSGASIVDATTTVKGKGEISTLAEVATGLDNTRWVTPEGVRQERNALKTELLGGASAAWDTLQELKTLIDAAEESSTITALTTTVAGKATLPSVGKLTTYIYYNTGSSSYADSSSLDRTKYVVTYVGPVTPTTSNAVGISTDDDLFFETV